MDRFYKDYDSRYAGATVLYLDASGSAPFFAYFDKECTRPVNSEQLFELAKSGVVFYMPGDDEHGIAPEYYAPISYSPSNSISGSPAVVRVAVYVNGSVAIFAITGYYQLSDAPIPIMEEPEIG